MNSVVYKTERFTVAAAGQATGVRHMQCPYSTRRELDLHTSALRLAYNLYEQQLSETHSSVHARRAGVVSTDTVLAPGLVRP